MKIRNLYRVVLALGVLCFAGCRAWDFMKKCPLVQMVTHETEQAVDMAAEPFRQVTIMSWNLRAGLGMDGVRDITRAGAVIKREDPDVVALQEIDRLTKRAGGIDQLVQLADVTGLNATWCKTIDFDGGEYGIALLSKTAPLRVQRIDLPGSGEHRMLLLAEFPRYWVGVTHLPLEEKDRLAAVPILRGALDPAKPLFLAGDWNDVPGSEFLNKVRLPYAILSGFDKTFPSDAPDRCLDYIAVTRRHRARYEHVDRKVLPESVISDHRPIVVTAR